MKLHSWGNAGSKKAAELKVRREAELALWDSKGKEAFTTGTAGLYR